MRMPLLPLLLLACEYDPETWRSPLASGFSGTPSVEEGERIFYEEHWEDDTPYALTCNSCHNAEPGDRLTVDDDETLNRAGHTVYNAALRGEWKNKHRWDDLDDDQIGAFGGQVCVDVFFPGDSVMTAEEAAHLEAFLKTRADAEPAEGDARAQPLGVDYAKWPTQDDFVADLGSAVGADLGDVDAGAAHAARHCGACHASGEGGALEFFTLGTATPTSLAARIRRTTIDGVGGGNVRMPRLPHTRLPDEDLRDLLAWLSVPTE
jgi:mono/diheme cytochrome c family protein